MPSSTDIRGFRADIEGLRAVAVLPILLFHLDPAWVPGGFIGVDIFFVISGYLISGQILKAGPGGLRLRAFYIRRVRRLFPALAVTVALSLIAGWRLLTPSDYAALAASALASLAAVANLYFYFAVDYFNASALQHPLLHLWSLGVEEQFYLVWPLLLLLAGRRGPRAIAALIVVTLIGSLLAAEVARRANPQLAFYLTPFRMAEFAIGAAARVLRQPARGAPASLSSAIGAAMVGVALAAFDSTTPWPGMNAMLPAVGTGLLLWAGPASAAYPLLALPPLRWIGRISYSVYLMHWPLIVFYRGGSSVQPSLAELAGCSWRRSASARLCITVWSACSGRPLNRIVPSRRGMSSQISGCAGPSLCFRSCRFAPRPLRSQRLPTTASRSARPAAACSSRAR